jgi:hypothetical protein
VVVAILGALTGCGGDDAAEPTTVAPTEAVTEAAPAAPTDEATDTPPAAAAQGDDVATIVATLADDELQGRDNDTPASDAAQAYLVEQLAGFAQPLDEFPDFRQPFPQGVNLLAVVPGTDLADEHVIVGAHYDHLAIGDCRNVTSADDICNGATDNATGVAAAIEAVRAIAAAPEPPRRSILLALWDREEDGLLGSAAYVADPAIPLDQAIAYVNFDIQGANLSPSLTEVTVMIGAETGGPNLVASALAATESSTLQTAAFSLLFGQGRSDHASFVPAGVPSVFFTDANGPCYHTVGDDLSVVDFDKLTQQIATATALLADLVATDTGPVIDPAAPPASFADAESMLAIVTLGQPDVARYSNADRAFLERFLADLTAIVDAGPDAFDEAAVGTLLSGSLTLVELLASGACDGFLAPG